LGDYDKAIEAALKSLKLQKGLGDEARLLAIYSELAVFYRDNEDFDQALKYAVLAKDMYASQRNSDRTSQAFLQLGTVYLFKGQLDSASYYIQKEYDLEKAENDVGGYVYNMMGYLETLKKNYPDALKYYRASLESGAGLNNFFDVLNTYTYLSQL
jgi:tetratricopeptide (TPR) repeat protein